MVAYPTDLGGMGRIDWTLSGNFNKTKITKVKAAPTALATTSTAFPTGQVLFAGNAASLLEKAAPKYKIGLNGLYTFGKLSLSLTETFYGKASALSDPGTGPLQNTVASSAAITDAELSYKFPVGVHRRDRGQQPVQQVSGQAHGRVPDRLYRFGRRLRDPVPRLLALRHQRRLLLRPTDLRLLRLGPGLKREGAGRKVRPFCLRRA